MITTLGKQQVKSALPDKFKSWADQPLTKKRIQQLTTQIAKEMPDEYVNILQKLNAVGQNTVSNYGKDTTVTLDDLSIGAQVRDAHKKIKQLISNVLNAPGLTPEQKENKIKQLGYKYSQKVQDLVVQDAIKRKSGFASQILSGSRGNPVQMMQMLFGNMMMRDALNRDIPYIAVDPYAQGVSPMAYWVGASSGRKGTYDVQAATARAGYLGKQATNITHATPISMQDCGTQDTGIVVSATNPDNQGALLLRSFHNHPAGSPVTAAMMAQADDGQQMLLRSPTTCKAKHGVCAHCSGLQQNGKFPAVGEYVPLNAAKTFIQAATQAGVGSKHVGGVGGKKVQDPQGQDQPTGFDSVERMFSAPAKFPGGAILAQADGRINSIQAAPQGGSYITVGSQVLYSPQARTIQVKVGDNVEAGDMLTNGVPNPMQVVHYKGLGQGRRYFTDKLYDILKKANFGTARRNVQQFSRSFLNKVQITDPDGYKGHYPGDIVDYDDLAASWQPRQNAKKMDTNRAVGNYLQSPALYYTIGTKITPRVAKNLDKYNFKQVMVNDQPPPFDPQFVRSKFFMIEDKNWIPRFSGQRVKSAIFDAAQRGMTDQYGSPSFVDKIVAQPYKP